MIAEYLKDLEHQYALCRHVNPGRASKRLIRLVGTGLVLRVV